MKIRIELSAEVNGKTVTKSKTVNVPKGKSVALHLVQIAGLLVYEPAIAIDRVIARPDLPGFERRAAA